MAKTMMKISKKNQRKYSRQFILWIRLEISRLFLNKHDMI